ncbi:Xyloglucan galactosyltransferase [Actinidia chinensis var. chinensis]|uniref:Xyloglucan galactosyltransferase n=1 Tax=Actinidia chinensis var. chinensis TaxID=1590841 RepID=A0A2R6RL12_ACTCC|nr:Xyloglucan galactosyltransferase [Actinidia chinensis var. chinensis]
MLRTKIYGTMLAPILGQSQSEIGGSKKPKTLEPKTSRPILSNRSILFIVILLQFVLVAYFTRAPNVSSVPSRWNSQEFRPAGCESGTIYVYDLPAMFNIDLQHKCNDLDPWASKCKANLNGGFGPPAKELAGIVPENILPAWYWTDHYWGEVVYHNRMLNYKCRTMEPESATAFYIPFYVGLAVGNYLWGNHSAKERDWHCEMMLKWVQEQKWWKRSNGADHMLMLGRLTWDFRRLTDDDDDWGTKFLHMPAMQNVIRLSVERHVWDPLEVAVPYPTIFHPRTKSDVLEWQTFVRRRRRTSLFAFVGGRREKIKNDFRGLLQDQCTAAPDACRHVDCARKSCLDGTTAILEAFLDSDFCLQPRGDGFTRRSVFDCMMAGSIPVFFWRQTAYLQYEWFVPTEPGRYSVFIHRDYVRNGTSIRQVLEGYGREEVARMREKVVEYIPKFVYSDPSEGSGNPRDAFEIAMNGVLRKFKDHMERGRLGKRNDVQ